MFSLNIGKRIEALKAARKNATNILEELETLGRIFTMGACDEEVEFREFDSEEKVLIKCNLPHGHDGYHVGKFAGRKEPDKRFIISWHNVFDAERNIRAIENPDRWGILINNLKESLIGIIK